MRIFWLGCGMQWVEAGLWGLAGGFIAEGLDLYSVVRAKGTWPWRVPAPDAETPVPGPGAYLIVETIRLLIGGLLAGAAAASGQVSGPLAAVAIGIATPLVVVKLAESAFPSAGIPATAITTNAPSAASSGHSQPAVQPAEPTPLAGQAVEGEVTR
ncbi:hypothetical protein [Amycolatopsis sp. NPDC050768]|uniref:hypothetical protein n=1 Tax=Amycolatopsis sp. NPDC050768 TaxID=3154839 RepID=UPI0033D7AB31